MTMWSYCGSANLCILADEKIIPDGWLVYNYFVQELDQLVALLPDTQRDPQQAALPT